MNKSLKYTILIFVIFLQSCAGRYTEEEIRLMGKLKQLEINKSMPEAMECVWSNFKKNDYHEWLGLIPDVNMTEIPNTNKGLITVTSQGSQMGPKFIVDFESKKNELTLVTMHIDNKTIFSERRKKTALDIMKKCE